ncbi:MAG: hypothetical protein AAFU64_16745 [Bacteroidota bacterium]
MKTEIILKLLHDQGFLCCYTMDEITPETAILIHQQPSRYFQSRDLDYNNMFLALRQPEKLPPNYKVGYLSKGDHVIPDYISDLRCASYFRYNTLGEIIPSGTYRTIRKCKDNFRRLTNEQQMLFCTIEMLNLNADRLKQQRKAILNQVTQLGKKYSRAQLAKFAEKLKKRDKETGKYRRYREVMLYYLQNL